MPTHSRQYRHEAEGETSVQRTERARKYAAHATSEQLKSNLYWKGIRAVFGLTPAELWLIRPQD